MMAPATEQPKPSGRRLVVRGSRPFLNYLDDLAAKLRLTRSGVVDVAIANLAEAKGFPPPPKR